MNTKEIFKDFLKNNPYYVMHETDVLNQNIEHFFVFFELKDILKQSKISNLSRDPKEVEIIITYLDSFQNNSMMQNLSESTINFITQHKQKLIYIPLVSMDNQHHFYIKRKKDLEENYTHLLSLKMLGEPLKPDEHLNMQVESTMSDIADIGLGITTFAKEMIQEKTPLIKKNILNIGQKISTNIGNKIKSLKK